MTTPNLKTVATMTPGVLASLQVPAGISTGYTVPSNSAVKIATASLCNTSGEAISLTDAVTTNTSTTLTSAAGHFYSSDTGKTITGAGIPANTTITFVDAHTVTLSNAATATATGVSVSYSWAATTVIVSLSIVPSGGSTDQTHRVISNYSLLSGDTLPLNDLVSDALMGDGDSIALTASLGSRVDFVLTGTVMA